VKLAVVGTGLIGASVALAARRAGQADAVAGWDPDEEALAAAVERGAVDEAAGSLEDAVAGADLVVVAAPIAQLPRAVAAALEATEGATVTDVGSTKAAVAAVEKAGGKVMLPAAPAARAEA